MKIETQCKKCGGLLVMELPAEVETDPHLKALIMEKIAPTVVHDFCHDKLVQNEQSEILSKRLSTWTKICPPIFQETDVNKLPNRKAYDKAMEWTPGDKGLVLHGPTRSGKTRSAWSLLRRSFEAGKVVLGFTHGEFCANVAVMQFKDDQRARWLRLVKTVDVLLLDDLGKANMTNADGRGNFAEQMLTDVFDARTSGKLPVVFTTMFTSAEIAQGMSAERGAAFVSRMKEFCERVSFA